MRRLLDKTCFVALTGISLFANSAVQVDAENAPQPISISGFEENRPVRKDSLKLLFDDLSRGEEDQLGELWKAVLLSPASSSLKQKFSTDVFERNFFLVFEEYVRLKAYKDYRGYEVSVVHPHGPGKLALTEPALEPSYPRLGTEVAPYNFGKGVPTRAGAVTVGGAKAGTSVQWLRALGERKLKSRILTLLEKLVGNYKTYRRSSPIDRDRFSRENSRKELVALAGESAVAALDRSPHPKDLPSKSSDPEIPSMQKAIDAEKSGDKLASYYWFRVASEQANARLCDDAVKSAKHALEIHTKIRDGCIFYSVMLPDPQPPNPLAEGLVPTDVLGNLIECARAGDAKMLMKAAVAKANEVYGAESSVSEYQFCKYALLQVSNSFEEFDKLLEFKPRLLEVGGTNSAVEQIYNFAHARMVAHKPDEAEEVLVHLLAGQRKAFESNDFRLVKTLKFLARAKEDQRNFRGAAEDLTELVSIHELYALGHDQKHYLYLLAEALDKAGQKADAKRVRVRMNAKDRIPGAHEFRIEADKIYYDTRFSDAVKIKSMLVLLAKSEKRIKYSGSCAVIQEQIIPLAERSSDWATLAEVASKRCAIYERTPDVTAGRQWGCEPARYGRMDFYVIAAKAYLKLNKIAEAEQMVRRALRIMPDLREHEIRAAQEILSSRRRLGEQ